MIFRPYPSSLRSIFDLARLEVLDPELSLAFLMSKRSAYILQNLVAADLMDLGRYAVSLEDGGYFALQEGDDEVDVFDAATDGVRLEMIPVPAWETFSLVPEQPDENILSFTADSGPLFLRDPRGLCYWFATLSIDEAGTSGFILLRAQGAPTPTEFLVGDFLLLDIGSRFYEGAIVHAGGGVYRLIADPGGSYFGNSPPVVLADGDVIYLRCHYPVAVA